MEEGKEEKKNSSTKYIGFSNSGTITDLGKNLLPSSKIHTRL
jgi:hypothetical protein